MLNIDTLHTRDQIKKVLINLHTTAIKKGAFFIKIDNRKSDKKGKQIMTKSNIFKEHHGLLSHKIKLQITKIR